MYMYRGCVFVGTFVLVYYPRKIDYNDRVARLHGYDVRVPFDVAWAGFRTTVSWQVGKQTSERSKAGKLAMRDWNVSRPFEPCSPPHLSTTLRPHPASPFVAPCLYILAPASDFLFSLLRFTLSLSHRRCLLIPSFLRWVPACKVAASSEKERLDAWHHSGKERNGQRKTKGSASDGVNLL